MLGCRGGAPAQLAEYVRVSACRFALRRLRRLRIVAERERLAVRARGAGCGRADEAAVAAAGARLRAALGAEDRTRLEALMGLRDGPRLHDRTRRRRDAALYARCVGTLM